MAQKNSALTVATVQSAKTLEHNQDTANLREKQEESLFSVLSDIESLGVEIERLRDAMALVVENLEEEIPKSSNKGARRNTLLAARIPMYLSTLEIVFRSLSDCSARLNVTAEKGFEAYKFEKRRNQNEYKEI